MLPSSTSVVMKEFGIDATCISIILSQSIKMAWKHVSLSNQSSLTLSGWGSYICWGYKERTKYLINISKFSSHTKYVYILVKIIQLDNS